MVVVSPLTGVVPLPNGRFMAYKSRVTNYSRCLGWSSKYPRGTNQHRSGSWILMSREIPGTPKSGTPIPILLPYHSHKNPLKYGNGMGSLWGPGVPLLGVPEKILYNGPSGGWKENYDPLTLQVVDLLHSIYSSVFSREKSRYGCVQK